jgi:hypothetical protein
MLSYIRRVPLSIIVCKLVFLATCAFMVVSGRYPPAHAEDTAPLTVSNNASADVYGLEIRAGMQQVRVDGIALEIAELKANQKEMAADIRTNSLTLSNMDGKVAAVGAVLGFMHILGWVLEAREKKKAKVNV